MNAEDKELVDLAAIVAKSHRDICQVSCKVGVYKNLYVFFVIATANEDVAWLILDTAIGNIWSEQGVVGNGTVVECNNGTFTYYKGTIEL